MVPRRPPSTNKTQAWLGQRLALRTNGWGFQNLLQELNLCIFGLLGLTYCVGDGITPASPLLTASELKVIGGRATVAEMSVFERPVTQRSPLQTAKQAAAGISPKRKPPTPKTTVVGRLMGACSCDYWSVLRVVELCEVEEWGWGTPVRLLSTTEGTCHVAKQREHVCFFCILGRTS